MKSKYSKGIALIILGLFVGQLFSGHSDNQFVSVITSLVSVLGNLSAVYGIVMLFKKEKKTPTTEKDSMLTPDKK